MQKKACLLLFFLMISNQSVFGAAADAGAGAGVNEKANGAGTSSRKNKQKNGFYVEQIPGLDFMSAEQAFNAGVDAASRGARAVSNQYTELTVDQATNYGRQQRIIARAARGNILERILDSIEAHPIQAVMSFVTIIMQVKQWYKNRNQTDEPSPAQEESYTQQVRLLGTLASLSNTPEDAAYIAQKTALLKKRIRESIDVAIPDELLPHSPEKLIKNSRKENTALPLPSPEDKAQHQKLVASID